MSVDKAVFQQFRTSIERLGETAAPNEVPREQWVERAKDVFIDKLDARMAMDLECCIHCGMCAEACHFYEATENPKYTPIHKLDLLRRVYRRELSPMRWLYRPFTREIEADELEDYQELVFDACTECGRCDMMCPMGIQLSSMVHVTRQGLASAGLAPAELRAIEQEQSSSGTVFGTGPEQLMAVVEEIRALGIDVPVDKEKTTVMLLSTAPEVLLFKDALAATARILNKLGLDWTLRSGGFEAANFGKLAGHEVAQRLATKSIVDQALACGATTVIVPECGHAYPALRFDGANELGMELPFAVMAISEFIGHELDAGRLQLTNGASGQKVTYHDPCKIGRHGGVYEQPRNALTAMGAELIETDSNRRENYCCGGGAGGFLINRAAPLRQKAFEIKQRQFDDTGADAVVTACASCRLNFMAGAENAGWSTPVQSLVEMVAGNLAD
jgi:Fe-S oxidoreductase